MRDGCSCLLRGRGNTLEACQCYRVVFSWQAQHFGLLHLALSWQAQHCVTWRRCCFDESQCQGCANMTHCQKSWWGQHFASASNSGGSFTKIILFEFCKNCDGKLGGSLAPQCSFWKLVTRDYKEVSHEMLDLEACYVKIERSLARNVILARGKGALRSAKNLRELFYMY